MTTQPIAAAGPAPRATRRVFGLPWPAYTTSAERRSLVAGGLGWMLDAMDVALYSLVITQLVQHFSMTRARAGSLNTLTLLAGACGGLLFGYLADRIGRTRALMGSILVYSLASFACGFAPTLLWLALFRTLLGLGMGGEWATGASLIAEIWPAEHRAKALGLMQSSWAIGEMIAACVVLLVLPRFGWRAVFFVGVLPALVVLWIRRRVPESELWQKGSGAERGSLRLLWRPEIRWRGILATAMNACALFGYWGLFTWIPNYLQSSAASGGRGLTLMKTTAWLVVMGVGKWFGYTLFGFFADAVGRRRSYAAYLIVAAVLVPLYGMVQSPAALLLMGPLVAFFGTGYFSGYGTIASELFPTEVRATAMGLTYNAGRIVAAFAPPAVGGLADRHGFHAGFYLIAGAFLCAALLAFTLPETRGKALA